MDFMIGKGELLTSPVKVKPRYGTKVSPYSFKEAVFRLSPQFINCSDTIDELPSEACPGNYAVELVTINPDYLAKSYYPANLFRALEVEPIGSKNSVVIPEKRGSHSAPNQGVALQIYLASPRDVLRDIPNKIEGLIEESKEADDLRKIESITVPSPVLGSILNLENEAQDYFEIGIHLLPSSKNRMIQDAFFSYVKLCSVVCFSDLSFNAGNLWFIPVYGTRAQIEQLAKFTFIRVIRKMPTLRSVPIGFRSEKIQIKAKLTQEPPVASDVKVAILDGGLPEQNPI